MRADAMANFTGEQESASYESLEGPAIRPVGVFDLTFYVFIPGTLVVSLSVLVNLLLDLKRAKPHHRILLGLCISDIIGALFCVPFPGLRRVYDTRVETCGVVLFFVRAGLLGGTGYIMLLAAERFLALQAPFWYDNHVTGERAMVATVSMSLFILGVSATSFVGRTYVSPELDEARNQTGRDLCSIFPADGAKLTLFMTVYTTVTTVNLLLTVVFNTRVVWMLRKMRRQVSHSHHTPGIVVNTRQESALLRMVVVFSVVSIITNTSSAALNLTRALDGAIPEKVKHGSAMLLGSGFVLDPCVHLVFTATYRRRIRCWLRCRFRESALESATGTNANASTSGGPPARIS